MDGWYTFSFYSIHFSSWKIIPIIMVRYNAYMEWYDAPEDALVDDPMDVLLLVVVVVLLLGKYFEQVEDTVDSAVGNSI